MVAIKALSDSSQKWVGRASIAVPELIKGVKNPRRAWKAASKESEDNYKMSVVEAANQGRFGRGIERSSDEHWSAMTESKSLNRYPEGVQLGEGAWQQGFSPYQEVISRLQIPKRGVRGAQGNYQRAMAVGQAQNQARMRILTGK